MNKRTAVVTGSSGGLGSELCKHLAAAGFRIVLVDRDRGKSEAFAADLNRRFPDAAAACFAVDLSRHAEIDRVAREIVDAFPRIDALFNNAGVLTERLQFSPHGNELHFEVNALAPLHLIDALRPSLRAAGDAIVVNTSAGLAIGVGTLDIATLIRPKAFKKLYGPYASSKQTLNVLTVALADELATDGIRVRAADPGPNKTGLTRGPGTPLWMRLFYGLLPDAAQGARKIFDVGVAPAWGAQSGIIVSGGKAKALPPALVAPAFRAGLLRRCRELATAV